MWYGRDVLEDEEAYNIIMELYTTKYHEAAREIERCLGSQIGWDEKYDLVQEGFIRLIRHVETLKNRNLNGRVNYMKRTMKNLAIDEGRRRAKYRMLGLPDALDGETWGELASDMLTPEEEIVMDEEQREISRCLNVALGKLGERDHQLLMEKYANGLSEKAIANKMGIPESHVGTYLFRARSRMRKYYEEERR